MTKKYFGTKKGSLESSILGMWEQEATNMDARTKAYKEHRAKLEAAQKTRSEKLVGGQKKLDKDKDGDIDGADFAAIRKAKKKNEVKTAREMWEDALNQVNEWDLAHEMPEGAWAGTPGEIDEKKMSSADKQKAKKYRASPAGKKSAKAYKKKVSKAGYKPDKSRSKAAKKAAKLKMDHDPAKTDTGKKSDKIEINPKEEK